MPYSVKGCFAIIEDMVQILLMLEVVFTQTSKFEDLFCYLSISLYVMLYLYYAYICYVNVCLRTHKCI